jgi:hypothetical protein
MKAMYVVPKTETGCTVYEQTRLQYWIVRCYALDFSIHINYDLRYPKCLPEKL